MQEFVVTVVNAAPFSPPSAAAALWVEAEHNGQRYAFGPIDRPAKAETVQSLVRAKLRQLAGDPGWNSEPGLSVLGAEWLDYFGGQGWEELLWDLDGRRLEEGDGTHFAPPLEAAAAAEAGAAAEPAGLGTAVGEGLGSAQQVAAADRAVELGLNAGAAVQPGGVLVGVPVAAPHAAGAAAAGTAGQPPLRIGPAHPQGVERRSGGKAAAWLYFQGRSQWLGIYGSNTEAGCVHDASLVWRELRRGEDPSKVAVNYPHLGLAGDAALVAQLRALPDIPSLRAFLERWAQSKLPALMTRLQAGGGAMPEPESPTLPAPSVDGDAAAAGGSKGGEASSGAGADVAGAAGPRAKRARNKSPAAEGEGLPHLQSPATAPAAGREAAAAAPAAGPSATAVAAVAELPPGRQMRQHHPSAPTSPSAAAARPSSTGTAVAAASLSPLLPAGAMPLPAVAGPPVLVPLSARPFLLPFFQPFAPDMAVTGAAAGVQNPGPVFVNTYPSMPSAADKAATRGGAKGSKARSGARAGATGAAGPPSKPARQESQPAGGDGLPPLQTPGTAQAAGRQPAAGASAAAALPDPPYNMPAATAPAAPVAAPAPAAGLPSADDMLDELQPTLEPLLPAAALLRFERAFPRFSPS